MLNPKYCPKCGGEKPTYHVDICLKCGVPYEVKKPKKELVKKKPIEKKVMKKTVKLNP